MDRSWVLNHYYNLPQELVMPIDIAITLRNLHQIPKCTQIYWGFGNLEMVLLSDFYYLKHIYHPCHCLILYSSLFFWPFMPIAFIEQIQRPLCGRHCRLPTWYALPSLLFIFSIEAEYIRYSVIQPYWQPAIWVVRWPSYDQGDIRNFWKMFPWLTEGERPVKRPWTSLSAFGLLSCENMMLRITAAILQLWWLWPIPEDGGKYI